MYIILSLVLRTACALPRLPALMHRTVKRKAEEIKRRRLPLLSPQTVRSFIVSSSFASFFFYILQISPEIMEKIPILKKFRERERRLGKDVTLKAGPESLVKSSDCFPPRISMEAAASAPPATPCRDCSTVYIGDIPSTTRVSQLKVILRSQDTYPAHLTWQGAQRRAFLSYSDPAQAELMLLKLKGLNIEGHPVRVEMAREQRSRDDLPEELGK